MDHLFYSCFELSQGFHRTQCILWMYIGFLDPNVLEAYSNQFPVENLLLFTESVL